MTSNEAILAAVKARFESDPHFQELLFRTIGEAGQVFFTESYRHPESQQSRNNAVGVWLSHSTQWSGHQIGQIAYSAFEDANFHNVCSALAEHPDLAGMMETS